MLTVIVSLWLDGELLDSLATSLSDGGHGVLIPVTDVGDEVLGLLDHLSVLHHFVLGEFLLLGRVESLEEESVSSFTLIGGFTGLLGLQVVVLALSVISVVGVLVAIGVGVLGISVLI